MSNNFQKQHQTFVGDIDSKIAGTVTMSSHCRPDMIAHPDPSPIEYEAEVYQRGLKYERPPFTFKPLEWESLAMLQMSATSTGYVVGVRVFFPGSSVSRSLHCRNRFVELVLASSYQFDGSKTDLYRTPAAARRTAKIEKRLQSGPLCLRGWSRLRHFQISQPRF